MPISAEARVRSSWRRRPTSRPGPAWSSTRTSSTRCVPISTTSGCRAPLPPPRRCRSCCRPSRSTITAAPATTWCRARCNSCRGPRCPPRTAARAKREIDERLAFADGANRPYLHLVDGGVADNVGMRSVLATLESMEALHRAGVPTLLDRVRRIVVFVVNSVSTPRTHWDESERPPGAVSLLLQASGVPIEHYSYESVELLRDKAARWQSLRRLRNSPEFAASSESGDRRRPQGPGRRHRCHRRFVCGSQGQGRIRVPERAAHELRAAR